MGFTFDCLSPENFASAFAQALNCDVAVRTKIAQLFATIYFEKYCREKSLATVFQLLRLTGKSRNLF
jgi:hypothetical protein